MKLKNKNLGFTLVELLVVISIISILTIITASSFVESQKKSRDSARKANLRSLADAVSLYYADEGSFPGTVEITQLINSEGELSSGDTIYMKKLPNDSKAGSGDHLQFKYITGSSRSSFKVFANLENDQDSDCQTLCLEDEYNVTTGCCYVITSSNIGVTETLE